MHPCSVPALPFAARLRTRTVLVASADSSFRHRVSDVLSGMRWQVREAGGGADAWSQTESAMPDALIVDSWLPDLDRGEFLKDFRASFPEVDLVTADAATAHESPRGPHRQELLYALRRCSHESDTVAWKAGPELPAHEGDSTHSTLPVESLGERKVVELPVHAGTIMPVPQLQARNTSLAIKQATTSERLPELVGNASCMLEVSRRVRLVAPRSTPVLIEGPTGSGKELVAQALHRLSTRARKPFVAINCAAIPEALLEAELFGHTRGAFTGAVQGRVGRIEAADGGTLFLDEIGELPLALQSKLLRFVESGELQRVGDNQTVKVDARIVAATHRPLAQNAQAGSFRADLYYRLAVFLIRTPALIQHLDDLPLLVEHFLECLGREQPVKRIEKAAVTKLAAHSWPGNVRELEHVLERAVILAGDDPMLTAQEIDFGVIVN